MPVQGTPAEFYNQSDLIISDIDRVSGTSEYQRGGGQNIRRTATEAAMIQDASNARSADKLAGIERVLGEIGQRLIQLMQQFMTGEHVVRIVGMSHPTWVKFDADYIAGEFDFEVEAGSTAPNNESFKQQKAFEMNEVFGQYLGTYIDPMTFLPEVLRMMGVKDPTSMMMQPPPEQGGGQPQQGGMPPEGMPPEGMPPGMPPGMEGMMPGMEAMPPGMPPGMPGMPPGGDIPPEVMAELQAMSA
jgi:hypothetical protein